MRNSIKAVIVTAIILAAGFGIFHFAFQPKSDVSITLNVNGLPANTPWGVNITAHGSAPFNGTAWEIKNSTSRSITVHNLSSQGQFYLIMPCIYVQYMDWFGPTGNISAGWNPPYGLLQHTSQSTESNGGYFFILGGKAHYNLTVSYIPLFNESSVVYSAIYNNQSYSINGSFIHHEVTPGKFIVQFNTSNPSNPPLLTPLPGNGNSVIKLNSTFEVTKVGVSVPSGPSGSVYLNATSPGLPVTYSNSSDPAITLLLGLKFLGDSGQYGYRIYVEFTISK